MKIFRISNYFFVKNKNSSEIAFHCFIVIFCVYVYIYINFHWSLNFRVKWILCNVQTLLWIVLDFLPTIISRKMISFTVLFSLNISSFLSLLFSLFDILRVIDRFSNKNLYEFYIFTREIFIICVFISFNFHLFSIFNAKSN